MYGDGLQIGAQTGPPVERQPNQPSDTLFVSGLPQDLAEMELANLFVGCPGLVSTRMRRDRNQSVVGFAEFSDTTSAASAMVSLSGRLIRGSRVELMFARQNSRKRLRDSDSSNPAAAAYAVAATQQAMMAAAGLGRSTLSVPGANMGVTHASMFGGLAQPTVMTHPGMSAVATIPGMPTALARDASPTLYVEGFPDDVSEREVAHIFRPFPGFQTLRVRHKESTRNGVASKRVMCFVEFDNAYQAQVARTAVADYVFDRTNPAVGSLVVHFCKTSRRGHSGSSMHHQSHSSSAIGVGDH